MPQYKGYEIEIEGYEGSYSCYCPDLLGVVAAAKTQEELLTLMREAIDLHLEGIAEDELEESQNATALNQS